jgi:hypothetical protein
MSNEILDRTYARYGGWDRWREVRRIELSFVELAGPLLRLKGLHKTFPRPGRVAIWPHERRTVLLDYPIIGSRGVWENGRVRIARAGDPAEPGEPHRATFTGLAKYRRWSARDALYFFGYALWHYHALPFALAGARIIGSRQSGGDGGATVVAEFPDGVETHSRRQTFHFDPRGLILRHDYVADIVGVWARGAHEWGDYVTVNGFPIPMRRQVWARLGATRLPLPVLAAKLGDPAVLRDGDVGAQIT